MKLAQPVASADKHIAEDLLYLPEGKSGVLPLGVGFDLLGGFAGAVLYGSAKDAFKLFERFGPKGCGRAAGCIFAPHTHRLEKRLPGAVAAFQRLAVALWEYAIQMALVLDMRPFVRDARLYQPLHLLIGRQRHQAKARAEHDVE